MFEIPVKLEGLEKRRRSVSLFHILAGLFLATNTILIFKQLSYKALSLFITFFLLAASSLAYGILHKKIDKGYKFTWLLRALQFLAFLILAIFELNSETAFQSITLFLWTGICLVLLFTERFIFKQPAVKISDEGITVPGSISMKFINWNSVETVVLRQDYLTINLCNNKFLQYEILILLAGTEIERINSFCKEELGKQKSLNGRK